MTQQQSSHCFTLGFTLGFTRSFTLGFTRVLSGLGLLLALLVCCNSAQAFSFKEVIATAKAASQTTYKAPQKLTGALSKLDYDDYRAIHFKPSHALWPSSDFHVQFFAPGYRFTTPVTINIIDGKRVERLAFKRGDFVTGDNYPHHLPANLGFAGFRIHYDGYSGRQSLDDKNNELIAFLGASYFRAKARAQQYGISARALAIDTIAKTPEEFPRFRAFWIKKPPQGATSITLYGLLDSPSVSGAYRFVITPGEPASVTVHAVLFLRHPVHEFGLAAFSSMYLYGLGDHRPPTYLRPAVHDSQGLLIHDANDRWLWRPLTNPRHVRQYTFSLDNPQGFGLMQRNRSPFAYQSFSMAYQARPSAWVEPLNNWGKGQVRLIEIPSPAEYNDNIALFWTPAKQPAPKQAFKVAYRLLWGKSPVKQHLARAVTTLSTRRSLTHPTRLEIHFEGAPLSSPQDNIKPMIEVGDNGKLLISQLQCQPARASCRLTLDVASSDHQPLQLRAYLATDGKAVSETWDYVLTPARHE